MAKLTIKDIELHGKRVFVRVDYNVPMEEKDGSMVINDDTRIRATLPTLDFLVEKGGKIPSGRPAWEGPRGSVRTPCP